MSYHPSSANRINRSTLLSLLHASFEAGAYRFGRQSTLYWLAAFPGDLDVQLWQVRFHAAESRFTQASTLIEQINRLDPEWVEAWRLRNRLDGDDTSALGCRWVLGDDVEDPAGLPEWSLALRQARAEISQSRLQEAERVLDGVLQKNPDVVLAGLLHLEVVRLRGPKERYLALLARYRQRWPESLRLRLRMAEWMLETGQEAEGVRLLHECVSADTSGQVAGRMWGRRHGFRSLWPEGLEAPFDAAIPAEVATRMGWNQLEKGATPPAAAAPEVVDELLAIAAPLVEDEPEEAVEEIAEVAEPVEEILPEPVVTAGALDEIELEFEKLAKTLKKPELTRADGRYPTYVVFSSKKALEKKYGPQTTEVITTELTQLLDAIQKETSWQTQLFYADDAVKAKELGVTAVEDPTDAWKMKLAMTDLDQALSKKGAMIGAVLIVGNDEIVPFHRLPNPTEDLDPEVLSDNPYAALDSNFFVPEWPLGRLPDEAGSDAGYLLDAIRAMTQNHGGKTGKSAPASVNTDAIWEAVRLLTAFITGRNRKLYTNFGISASVWKKSSQAVYAKINDAAGLLSSPPVMSPGVDGKAITAARMAYFNLHGLEDGAEWYGQRDPAETPTGPDYPVALSPTDLHKNGKAPAVVFTEACYGGYIRNKTADTSLALKFLAVGTPAIVGSTCVSYGSINTPLVAADLLASFFWQNIQNGKSAGEAMMQAKIEMVKEMNQRQGFLDSEDQKTLISFVLYGDPLATANGKTSSVGKKLRKNFLRLKNLPKVKAVHDQEIRREDAPVSAEVLKQVKQIVENYLPGMENADMRVAMQQTGERAREGNSQAKAQGGQNTGRIIVTVSKEVRTRKVVHHQIVRVTLDQSGKMVKLVVSR